MCPTPVQWSEGNRPEIKRGEFMVPYDILKETVSPDPGQAVKQVFFTRKDNNLYAITPTWPGKLLTIDYSLFPIPYSLFTTRPSRVTFLQTGLPLKFKQSGDKLIITMPDYQPNAGWVNEAYAFKIEF
jgi:alpha-L-fucosidase